LPFSARFAEARQTLEAALENLARLINEIEEDPRVSTPISPPSTAPTPSFTPYTPTDPEKRAKRLGKIKEALTPKQVTFSSPLVQSQAGPSRIPTAEAETQLSIRASQLSISSPSPAQLPTPILAPPVLTPVVPEPSSNTPSDSTLPVHQRATVWFRTRNQHYPPREYKKVDIHYTTRGEDRGHFRASAVKIYFHPQTGEILHIYIRDNRTPAETQRLEDAFREPLA
jgi:hypothetical protein